MYISHRGWATVVGDHSEIRIYRGGIEFISVYATNKSILTKNDRVQKYGENVLI